MPISEDNGEILFLVKKPDNVLIYDVSFDSYLLPDETIIKYASSCDNEIKIRNDCLNSSRTLIQLFIVGGILGKKYNFDVMALTSAERTLHQSFCVKVM